MKRWTKPEMEELSINETAASFNCFPPRIIIPIYPCPKPGKKEDEEIHYDNDEADKLS
ncbi:MAG: hypothetical protein K6A23_04135 [Butyrivibrio sp.]|nr:hypothetical protein [Butyrivibrio sp.]